MKRSIVFFASLRSIPTHTRAQTIRKGVNIARRISAESVHIKSVNSHTKPLAHGPTQTAFYREQ